MNVPEMPRAPIIQDKMKLSLIVTIIMKRDNMLGYSQESRVFNACFLA